MRKAQKVIFSVKPYQAFAYIVFYKADLSHLSIFANWNVP